MDIEKALKNYAKATEEFTMAINEHNSTLKSQMRGHDLFSKVNYLPGDEVWFIPSSKIDFHNNSLDSNGLYIRDRMKIDPDGTDNRESMVPIEQLEINKGTIEGILFGKHPDRGYWDKNDAKWWYHIGYMGKWVTSDFIATSREMVLSRWSEEYIRLRDEAFQKRYAQIFSDKQEKIAAAKKLLEENGSV